MSTTETVNPAREERGARRSSKTYLIGPVLALLSIPAYLVWLDVPQLRSTALQSFALMIAGTVISLMTLKTDRRRRAKGAAIGTSGFLLLGTGMFFFATKLPQPAGAPEVGARVLGFTLPDQTGQPVNLASLYERGLTLLVFYRGHW
ncbi:MAG: hypothetical protein BroJett003_11380 [Planctomycetota bacterium]|nr:MAG: hypothetical protein BroJett003_11380 [Planctomycetota bacterium]